MSKRLVNVLLLFAAVAIVAVSFLVGVGRSPGEEGEKFGGTDSVVTEELEAGGHEPWFSPLFEPSSGEVESGLFALQAAIGAGAAGYCIGVLRGRRQARGGGRAGARDGADGASASAATPTP